MIKNASVWTDAVLPEGASIEQAISCLDQTALRLVLITDDKGLLIGTVSDGDIRRGLLKGHILSSSVSKVVNRKPLVVPVGLEPDMVLKLMTASKVLQIPIVDDENRIVGLHLWDLLTRVPERSTRMVIMAGGLGARLRPHTDNCPKPMLLLGGKPMLEHIIDRAKLEGFKDFLISIRYLGHMIEEYFGNGERLDVHLEYLREDEPLGTAGALSLIKCLPNEPIVVINGDVITDIRYGDLLEFHCQQKALATMAVRSHEWQNPYGVVHTAGVEIIGFEEKPVVRNYINAGVYVLDPSALKSLQYKKKCDMPDLFDNLRVRDQRVVAYAMHEPWLDVGRATDLKKARDTIAFSTKSYPAASAAASSELQELD